MRVLALEPYLGGSHARFLAELGARPEFDLELRGLPARGWKWRMRFGALHFADDLRRRPAAPADLILVSPYLDLPQFLGLAPAGLRDLPVAIYWHENQFAYPVRHRDERDLHFAVTNLLSARAADLNLFNSRYNLDSFRHGAEGLLRQVPDLRLESALEGLAERSRVFPLPLDLASEPACRDPRPDDGPPIVLWNHRREHDKNPERFFAALFVLAERGLAFRLALAGARFRTEPPVFAEARARLGARIIHDGEIPERSHYLRLLRRSSIAVSTANHDFFGLALAEAAVQGARPLAPRRLAYPEIYPDRCLYEDDELEERLAEEIGRGGGPDLDLIDRLEERAWSLQGPELARLIGELTQADRRIDR
ncbi:MAG: DUF3524 domain-containing protein [Planctomycetes bacterium]|nr:DUF3524 domain-containing protein [Planctomycetota bacterium]